MAVKVITPAVQIPETNFMQARVQIIEPIDLVEQIITTPLDLTGEFPVEEADGNTYSFEAYKKKTGYKGAVEWDKNDINTANPLDKLEMSQKTIIIDGEIIAGTQMKAVDIQSKGGKAVKVLQANTIAVTNDIRTGIYKRVRKGLFDTMSVETITGETIADLMTGLQTVYDNLMKTQIMTRETKGRWRIYVNEKTFNEIFGLNKTFTSTADGGGANNTLFQGIVWGLDPTTKNAIRWNEIPFRIIDNMNFENDEGETEFKAFLMDAERAGRVVYINGGAEGGIWTYPLTTNTKDNLVAMKGSATVQFVPHVYVYDDTNGIEGDKTPFAWAIKVQAGGSKS